MKNKKRSFIALFLDFFRGFKSPEKPIALLFFFTLQENLDFKYFDHNYMYMMKLHLIFLHGCRIYMPGNYIGLFSIC